MIRLKSIVLAMLLALQTIGLSFEVSAKEDLFSLRYMIEALDSGNKFDRDLTRTRIAATFEGVIWGLQYAKTEGVTAYCSSENIALGSDLAIAILRSQLTKYPERADLDFGMVLVLGLTEAFPCN